MKHSRIFLWLCTLGPIGYLPAPGTMGTLVTLPLVYLIHYFALSAFEQLSLILGIMVVSFIFVNRALDILKRHDDPSEIIIDEVVGTLITFFLIPINIKTLILGFLLFRFFDISKLGLKNIEKLFGAWGIIFDDIVAGILSCVILHIFLRYL